MDDIYKKKYIKYKKKYLIKKYKGGVYGLGLVSTCVTKCASVAANATLSAANAAANVLKGTANAVGNTANAVGNAAKIVGNIAVKGATVVEQATFVAACKNYTNNNFYFKNIIEITDLLKNFNDEITGNSCEKINDTILNNIIEKKYNYENLPKIINYFLDIKLQSCHLLDMIDPELKENIIKICNNQPQTYFNSTITPLFTEDIKNNIKNIFNLRDNLEHKESKNIWQSYSEILCIANCIIHWGV
jgi:hypothetical protein